MLARGARMHGHGTVLDLLGMGELLRSLPVQFKKYACLPPGANKILTNSNLMSFLLYV
jgi:hypothetical protein